MGRIKNRMMAAALAAMSLASCNWLDVSVDMGVSEGEVFGTYGNIKAYLDYCMCTEYRPTNLYLMMSTYEDYQLAYSLDITTDAADGGRLTVGTTEMKKCNLSWDTVAERNTGTPGYSYAMWQCIRVANDVLAHLDGITDCTQAELDELYGYCYFYRGMAHFALCRRYGGVPYIDRVIEDVRDGDMERLSNWETYHRAADDLYKSYEYLKKSGWMRRDARPGQPGHLQSSTQRFPSGMKALGFMARCLVYAASPLSNEHGQEDWKEAADACALLVDELREEEYDFVPFSAYETLFLTGKPTNESFWTFSSSFKDNAKSGRALFGYPQGFYHGDNGVCPTQNFVDRYETKWGDPLYTAEDRAEAERIGHYNPQDPYADLDPRFDATILHDGSVNPYVSGAVNIYRNVNGIWPPTSISGVSANFGMEWGTNDSGTDGYTNTGYYVKKYWEGKRGDKGSSHNHIENMFRIPEAYLLYAEAVNEAYGPNATVPDAGRYRHISGLTPVQAVNLVRNRCGMPDVQSRFTSDKELFRERIQNEKCIEFAFEGHHYYYDIRRWMIAPQTMRQTLTGMYVEECTEAEKVMTNADGSLTYPKGKKYTRRSIPASRQGTWKDCMYYFPFSKDQVNTMTNFKNNDLWH